MKTTARFTLADISRATRAAKEQGAAAVDILRDGTIRIRMSLTGADEIEDKPETKTPKIRDFKL
ncbi:hypothetical protein Q3C01_12270 [Bradyrhizobium sp. UFLA05-109]